MAVRLDGRLRLIWLGLWLLGGGLRLGESSSWLYSAFF